MADKGHDLRVKRYRLMGRLNNLLRRTVPAETEPDPDIRYYGGDGTIHQTGEINVQLDKNGEVVGVWFRCQLLPFTQNVLDDSRAEGMRSAYAEYSAPSIDAIVLRDRD